MYHPTSTLVPGVMEARWLLKDVDYFAGFAHAMHTYLSGVALASRHSMSLLHQPFQSAHGMNFAFDDFLSADPRGLVPPLTAPVLTLNDSGVKQIDGRHVSNVILVRRDVSAAGIESRLRSAAGRSLVFIRKGRGAIVERECNCSYGPEVREAGLWLRERFWQAVRAHEVAEYNQSAIRSRGDVEVDTSGGRRSSSSRARHEAASSKPRHRMTGSFSSSLPPVVISIHVRRGDVTYLDRYGLPSARWVETSSVLDVLRGVAKSIGMELRLPRVEVHLHSEFKGWYANDTAALRALAPDVKLHLDSSPYATINAIVQMARSDILLMGSSGFSTWAGLLSCGIKVGPSFLPPLPIRHVNYSCTLRRHYGPFVAFAGQEFSKVWSEYWGCKTSPACRPSLCGPTRITNPLWLSSKLSRDAIADITGAQWHVPAWPPGTSFDSHSEAQQQRDTEKNDTEHNGGMRAAWHACERTAATGVKPLWSVRHLAWMRSCARQEWSRNLTRFIKGKGSPPPAVQAGASSEKRTHEATVEKEARKHNNITSERSMLSSSQHAQ